MRKAAVIVACKEKVAQRRRLKTKAEVMVCCYISLGRPNDFKVVKKGEKDLRSVWDRKHGGLDTQRGESQTGLVEEDLRRLDCLYSSKLMKRSVDEYST